MSSSWRLTLRPSLLCKNTRCPGHKCWLIEPDKFLRDSDQTLVGGFMLRLRADLASPTPIALVQYKFRWTIWCWYLTLNSLHIWNSQITKHMLLPLLLANTKPSLWWDMTSFQGSSVWVCVCARAHARIFKNRHTIPTVTITLSFN